MSKTNYRSSTHLGQEAQKIEGRLGSKKKVYSPHKKAILTNQTYKPAPSGDKNKNTGMTNMHISLNSHKKQVLKMGTLGTSRSCVKQLS
jgi:hypothetical protein